MTRATGRALLLATSHVLVAAMLTVSAVACVILALQCVVWQFAKSTGFRFLNRLVGLNG